MAETTIHYSGPVLSRLDAASAGQTRFFTGIPCKYGHISQRMTSNKICYVCLLGRNRKFWNEHRALSLARNKRWRDKNIECIREIGVKNSRIFRKRYPEVTRKHLDALRNKKVSAQEKIAGRKKSESCEICGNATRRIVFDHCHAKGHFRGWLCNHCNAALGLASDSPAVLRKMAKYLEEIS